MLGSGLGAWVGGEAVVYNENTHQKNSSSWTDGRAIHPSVNNYRHVYIAVGGLFVRAAGYIQLPWVAQVAQQCETDGRKETDDERFTN